MSNNTIIPCTPVGGDAPWPGSRGGGRRVERPEAGEVLLLVVAADRCRPPHARRAPPPPLPGECRRPAGLRLGAPLPPMPVALLCRRSPAPAASGLMTRP